MKKKQKTWREQLDIVIKEYDNFGNKDNVYSKQEITKFIKKVEDLLSYCNEDDDNEELVSIHNYDTLKINFHNAYYSESADSMSDALLYIFTGSEIKASDYRYNKNTNILTMDF